MKLRNYILFLLLTVLFLFYPGDSEYYQIFAWNKNLFSKENPTRPPLQGNIPYVKNGTIPDLTAEGVYVVDLPSFTPIFQRNEHAQMFPASTTKIITALVAYDLFDLEDVVTIDRVLNEGQVMGLVKGENITVENLLYGMLVFSGNDAAFALADHYGFDKFIDKMNEKARALHMVNSNFKNPAGLDNPQQYTSPFDLALAAREVLKNKTLSKITSTRDITISDNDYIYFHRLENVNKLLGEVHGIGGLKTGYTENAGENLVSFYKNKGHQYIIVILKSKDRFADTKNVVKWINDSVDFTSL